MSSSESCRWVSCAIETTGLIERSVCTEEFTLKSNRTPTTEFWLIVIGKGALDSVAVAGVKLGVSSQTELLAQEPIAAPEWFTIVIFAVPKVSVMLLNVSAGTLARLRNAESVCKCPNSISTGLDSADTAGLLVSDGCRLAPVIKASKKSIATPFGGVSPIIKLMGTPFVTTGVEFIEPPQAIMKMQITSANAKEIFRFITMPPSSWRDSWIHPV